MSSLVDVAPAAPPLPPELPRGVRLLHDPLRNKGTAFTAAERKALGLEGLLPPRVLTQELQARRVLANLRRQANDLERYVSMSELQDRNEVLFHRVLLDNIEELMPVVYTPTVGKACQQFGHIFRRPRGVWISANHRGRVKELLANWSTRDVRVIVVTDGERILGLGDLGADGMGIPIGKLALYTACAGIHPSWTLPVTLDVGTDNEALLADPLYFGLAQHRLRGEAYDELVEEFFLAATELFPRAVVQFEDFATGNAFRLLERYRGRGCCFNDDIQGTAAVTVAGLRSAQRLTGGAPGGRNYLFLGAGEAGIGIADLLVQSLVQEGMDEAAARRKCWFMDSRGLVVASRSDLASHKRAYAHDAPGAADLVEAIERLRPGALVGASGQPQTFTRPVLEAMARVNERPIVFALSNPTSKAECTAEQAYRWTDAKAVFASGSPFDAVEGDGWRFEPGQANNAYVFPGVGLGLVVSRASACTDEMFYAAARALAGTVDEADFAVGRVYPRLRRIREVSARIAEAVAGVAFARGLARADPPADLTETVRATMFWPDYPTLD